MQLIHRTRPCAACVPGGEGGGGERQRGTEHSPKERNKKKSLFNTFCNPALETTASTSQIQQHLPHARLVCIVNSKAWRFVPTSGVNMKYPNIRGRLPNTTTRTRANTRPIWKSGQCCGWSFFRACVARESKHKGRAKTGAVVRGHPAGWVGLLGRSVFFLRRSLAGGERGAT